MPLRHSTAATARPRRLAALLAALLALALAPPLFAQAGQPETEAPPATQKPMRERMRQHQEQMMQQMQEEDARLEELVARMNQAEGEERVDALMAVVNELADQRLTMRRRMQQMREGKQGGMSGGEGMGSESAPGAASP